MNNCSQLSEQLSAYADGELPASESAQIEAHLATCPDCAAELDVYRRSGEALRHVINAQADAADFSGFTERLNARLDAPTGNVTWLAQHRGPVLALAAAALLLIALLLGPLLVLDAEPEADCVVELVEPPEGYDAKVIEGEGQNVTVIWLYETDTPPETAPGEDPSL